MMPMGMPEEYEEQYEEQYEEAPEPAQMVGELQVPAAPWVWDSNKMLIVGVGLVAAVALVWFIKDFTSAKHAHEHASEGSE